MTCKNCDNMKMSALLLGDHNGKPMFERLKSIVEEYNNSDQGKAVLQEFDANTEKVLILCIVTGLMSQV